MTQTSDPQSTSQPSGEPPSGVPGVTRRQLLFALSGMAVLIVTIVLVVAVLLAMKSPGGREELMKAEARVERVERELAAERAGYSAQTRRVEILREKYDDIQSTASAALKRLDGVLEPLAKELQQLIADIETGSTGRELAASETLLLQYAEFRREKLSDPPMSATWRPKLEALRDGALEVMEEAAITEGPLPESVVALQGVSGSIEGSIERHEAALEDLRKLVALALADKFPPGQGTVEAALAHTEEAGRAEELELFGRKIEEREAARRAELERRAEQLADDIALVRTEMTEKLAAQQLEHAKEIAELTEASAVAVLRREEAEVDARRTALEEEAQAREAEAKKAELRKKASSLEVREALRPFTAHDYFQLGDEVVTEPSSMSWTALQHSSVLGSGKNAMVHLYDYVVFHKSNRRPKGSWGTIAGENGVYTMQDPEKVAFIARAQGYLRDLGPVLVEMKQLRP